MTLQSLNFTAVVLWLVFGSLSRLTDLFLVNLIFAVITWLIVFILAGTSLAYIFFRRNEKIISDKILLVSIGILISLFIIPLFLFLVSTKIPLNNSLVLASIYIFFLFAPNLGSRIHIQSMFRLRLFWHPVFFAVIIVFLVMFYSLSQYSFLPGLDTYSWLMTYENSLDHKLYDLTAGVNRILFSTLVAVSHQLSSISYFNLFKYWFPFFSLLTAFPLWLIARSLKNVGIQLVILLSSLISPAVILDFGTTRHQIVVMLFLYLAIGILFTAHKHKLKSVLWLTFIASFIGILYHPLFLVITVIWAFAVLGLNRKTLQKHPLFSIVIVLFFYFILAQYFKFNTLIHNLIARFQPVLSNFVTLNWNLQYPTHFISEGVEMGWPGAIGVLKFYGYYSGPLVLLTLFVFLFSILIIKKVRIKFIQCLCSPYFFPLIGFGTLLFFLGEIFPRISPVTFLPDRALTLLGIFIPVLLVILAQSFKTLFNSKIVSTALLLLLSISVAGSLYINGAIAYTIPEFELEAADWIVNNLPDDRYFFMSSSKNVLRYYARSKSLRMGPEIIASNSMAEIFSAINVEREVFKDSNTYIYYAVTDSRNPYVQRPYASSFTGARPDSLFPAISSHPEYFELVYHQPNKVYIWSIKDIPYE